MFGLSQCKKRWNTGSLYFGRLLCAFLCLCIPGAGGRAFAADTKKDSSVVALVNKAIITREAFQLELDRNRRMQGAKAQTADETMLSNLKREALENLISRELLLQESRKRKIKVDTKEVDQEFKRLKGQFADEKQFSDTMTRLKLSEATLREQITGGIAIRGVINNEIGSKITVTDDEISRYYEQNKDRFTQPAKALISHILIEKNPDWDADRKKDAADRIAALKTRIDKGEDFTTLAKRYSEDKQSREQGGVLGWFAGGQLSGEVEKELKTLKAGQVSPVVEDRFGLHLIKVLERMDVYTPVLAELKGKIRGMIIQEKGNKLLQPFVKKLRDSAKVEILMTGDVE